MSNKKEYKSITRQYPAKARSKNRNEAGHGSGSSLIVNEGGSGGTETTGNHVHNNLELLNQFALDDEKYLLLRSYELDEETDDTLIIDEKIKAGYADKAHDLDEDSPVNKRFLSRQKEDTAAGKITFENGIIVKSELTLNRLRKNASTAITEDGEYGGIIEEGDGDTSRLSVAITEQAAAGGFDGGTLGELDNVDPLADIALNGSVLIRQGETWVPVSNAFIKPAKISGKNISTIQELIDYLSEFGTGYPEVNTPPVLLTKENRFIFKPEDSFTIDVTLFDKEGGELTLVGKKPEGTYLGTDDTFMVKGLSSGAYQLNLKELVFGKNGMQTFGIGSWLLSDIYLYDAFGRRSENPVNLTVVVGSVNVTSAFDETKPYDKNKSINVDYRISSVAREVTVQIVTGGQTMKRAGNELVYTNVAAQTTEFDLSLADEDSFVPAQSYSQTFTTPSFPEAGEYTVEINVWEKENKTLRSKTITKRIVVLEDNIVYISSPFNVYADYRVSDTVLIPVNIYHTGTDCTYKVRAWVQNAEAISVETTTSAEKKLELLFALPDEANTYTICLQAEIVSPTGINYSSNSKNLTLNVRSISKYSVLTAPEYNLELFLSANGLSNSLPEWQRWKNKYYLSQDYYGTLQGYINGINGWIDHADGNSNRPADGDCLHSSGEAACLINYSPFRNFTNKSQRVGEGVTIEILLHNSDKYGAGMYTFSVGNPFATRKKGFTIDTQRMTIYTSATDTITVPVRTGTDYLTKTGDFIANSDEYMHITVTYDIYNKLVLVFCNGVISAATTFNDASWIETDAPVIVNGYLREDGTIGGQSEGKVKFVRCYQKCLGFEDVLNNYIASITFDKDREHAESINDPNNPFLSSFNVFGNLSGATKENAVPAWATMTIGREAELFDRYLFSPQAQSQVEQQYADLSERHPITASWQGNSSLAYPIKNWEFGFFDPESEPDEKGERESKKFNMVKHLNGIRPWYDTDEYHCKTNYIDSSACNNQGIAKLAHYAYNVPWNWTEEDCVKYCNGSRKPFPHYTLEDGSKSRYPVKPPRLAIDANPFLLMRQNQDAAGNLLPLGFGGLTTWGLKQNELLYGMLDYKKDPWHKNTIWRSESNGDSVHPQLRAGAYGLFDLEKISLKVDLLDRPLSDDYIREKGLVEGIDYYDLNLPERATIRDEQMKWRVGAETVMDFECRNPKSLGRGHWEELVNSKWVATNNLISPRDLDPASKAPDKILRWVWDEFDIVKGQPLRKKGSPSVGYFNDMFTSETVPFLGSEDGGIGKINKELGELASQQHADFINAMKWVDNAPDECFANPEIFGKYFHLQSCIDYIILSITLYLSDQLGRNLTFVQWDNRKIDKLNKALLGNMPVFYPVMYDMDTALGTNVQGTLTEDAFKGWQYPIGNIHNNSLYYQPDGDAFENYNCGESRFWRRISALYGDTIIRRYTDLRSGVDGQEGTDTGVLTHNFIISTFCKEIISRIGERIYNQDAQYKYLGTDYDSQAVVDSKRKYLVNARGNKLPFINQFILDRLSYIDSLFRYEPQGSAVSEMVYFQHRYSGTFEITMKTDIPAYIRVSFAQNQSSYVYSDGKAPVKVSYTYQNVGGTASEKILRIYNAAPITHLSGFANKQITKAKLSTASSLKTFDLSGNPTLNELELKGCRNLEELCLNGCNYSEGFNADIFNCVLLKKFIAKGSTVYTGDFSRNPYVEEIDIRDCGNVNILNLNNLQKVKNLQFTPLNINVISLNNSSVNVDISECDNLISLSAVDNPAIISLASKSGFRKLESVDIRNCPKLEDISFLLKGNKLLSSLDSTFLSGSKAKIKFMNHTFEDSTIENVPDDLCSGMPELISVTAAFAGSSLKGSIEKFFYDSKKLSIVNQCFDCCKGITGKSSNSDGARLWERNSSYTPILVFSNCYKGCVNMTDYKDVPIAWGGAPVTKFVFKSSQSRVISNSTLICSHPFKKISDTTYEVYAPEEAEVDITFECDNHKPFSTQYLVIGSRTQEYSVAYIPLRTIRVNVYGTSVYLAGARVTINGVNHISDSKGNIYLRGEEAVSGDVSITGYSGSSFSFGSITSDTSNTVYVYKSVDVKLIVKNEFDTLIHGATVLCEGKSYVTNSYGECILSLGKGKYDFIVKCPRYLDYSGSLEVGTISATFNVAIKLDIEPFRPVENENIQLLLSNQESSFTVTSDTDNYSIDWGDGNTELAKGKDIQSYSHSYKDNNFYQVEIKDCGSIRNLNVSKDCLICFWSIGNSNISNLSFDSYTKLKTVGSAFKNDSNRSNFSRCFYSCRCLISIPSDIFNRCIAATNFSNCFYGCNCLTSIPSGLFDNCPYVQDFNSCFSGCTTLQAIPPGLFDKCIRIKYISWCFSGCRSIRSIPSGIFNNCSAVTSFSNSFGYCVNLISVSSGLFDNCQSAKSFHMCFTDCISLVSLPSGLFSNCPLAEDFSRCFLNCESLTSIPPDIFKNCSAVTNFSYCFYKCTNLMSIPSGLFDDCSLAEDYSRCFNECKKITSIPPNLFHNCLSVKTFYYCFCECNSLISIPSGLFDNCQLVTDFSYCFCRCSDLDSLPFELFNNCPLANNFNMCFYYCSGITTKVPDLWVQYHDKTVNKNSCYTNCNSAENSHEIPKSWGGNGPEYIPTMALTNTLPEADYITLNERIRRIENLLNKQ